MGKPDQARVAKVQADVVAIVAKIYRDKKRTEAQILAFDPNDIDELDPSMLYEILSERYAVEFDDENDLFGGFGGKVSHTIEFIAGRWDGTTMIDVELPPTEDYWD